MRFYKNVSADSLYLISTIVSILAVVLVVWCIFSELFKCLSSDVMGVKFSEQPNFRLIVENIDL